ncbi:MAG: Phosphoribosyl-ATP pyrophosphatase [Alphaproteobacteria bacterium MarineAlpha5_Bin12]|nr:MAG: Phosphoribosyl-ATP pyrophosphatase [Alphaproteobacteria bacterium MarineAlpha5_Bin12]
MKRGNKQIAQKVMEESSELIIDFLKGSKKRTIEEAADLIFHLLILLNKKNILPKDLAKELKSRYKK